MNKTDKEIAGKNGGRNDLEENLHNITYIFYSYNIFLFLELEKLKRKLNQDESQSVLVKIEHHFITVLICQYFTVNSNNEFEEE